MSILRRFSLPDRLRRLLSVFPSGGALPDNVWRKRRAFLLGLAWFHAAIIALVGPVFGYSWERSVAALFRDGTVLHTVAAGLIVALFAALGSWRRGGRTLQASAIAFALMSSSAILVHLSGGYIELHFHFFVMLSFLALLQDWVPYILAILYVVVHHGVVGTLWPQEVFNHSAAFNAPWTWSAIHAFFILSSSIGSLIAWRFTELASAKMKAQSEQLQNFTKLQADFVAMVAHDLRSPLTNVMSAASMLQDGFLGPVSAEQIKWLGKIETSSRNVVSLINDFLDISKMEAGRIDLVKEKIDLYQLIHASLDNFIPLARSKNISLIGRIPAALSSVSADPRRMDQVLSNLLSNAIKFTPQGKEIEVGVHQEGKREVILWVRDSGIGIQEDEIGELFNKYRQTRSGKSSPQQGTGLGLAICKMIVEAHGGRIWVESEPGKGSTFTVSIPCSGG